MIDIHVHFRDGVQSEKETIEHGYGVAHKAGILSCFDMPNTQPPLTSKDAIEKRLVMGQASVTKVNEKATYRIYAGLTSSEEQIEEMVALYNKHFPRIVGFKMFAGHSTGNMGIVEKDEQRKVYAELVKQDYRGVVAVHCEKTSRMNEALFNPDEPYTHGTARPAIAEIESINDQIELIQETNFKGHLHVCHISCQAGIEAVRVAKTREMNISCGATAHHALLNEEAYADLGLLAKMNPPLRNEQDRSAVFASLLCGDIDMIESDHAPHTLKDKQAGASGIPGFAGTLLLIKALRQAGIDEELLNRLCGKNANTIFSISLPVSVPSNKRIDEILQEVRSAYPFDAFRTCKF